ncbi:MAG: four helix bundle protein [Bacteroidales bacterium]|nr:four helix bundle protein [Bacteroidales bacterium]
MNDQTNKPLTFFRFEDLRIYHKALDYIIWVQMITDNFPAIDSKLADSFCSTARRIALDIAEGSAREKVHFVSHLKEAKSAIRACLVYTTIAYKNSYITDADEEDSRNQLMEMTKMLGALITSLQKNSSGMQEQFDDETYPAKSW